LISIQLYLNKNSCFVNRTFVQLATMPMRASFKIEQVFDLQFQVSVGLFLLKKQSKKAYKKLSLTTEYRIEVTKTGGYYRGG